MRTLYYHGTVITMETDMIAEAVLVEDERIVAVGTDEELMKYKQPDDLLIDLHQHTMLPGFVDGHSHFTGVASSLAQCDLSEATSYNEIVQALKAFIEAHGIKEGEWVQGRAYDHNFLMEETHPNRHILDEVSTSHPILITHTSSHMGVANTLALEKMGIKDDTPDPKGGKYGRESDQRTPNGYMEENALFQIQNALPMVDVNSLLELMKQAQQLYASYGITTVQEGMAAEPVFQLLKYAGDQGVLYLDVVAYIDLRQAKHVASDDSYDQQAYHHHVRIGGYKIFLDGSPQGRTAWMSAPYENASDGYCGYPVLKNEEVYDLIEQAVSDQMQLLAHCNGDAAAEQYISQFEQVMRAHPEAVSCHPIMIHAQLVREDQLKRMIPLDMIPSFFVAHTYYWGDIHIKNFGWKRASKISPLRDAQALNLPFTLHQDSPVILPDMMKTVWCAVNRETKTGVVLGEEERISPMEALRAITIYGAKAYGEEREKGSIQAGKYADLVILNQNPLTAAPEKLKDIHVLETIKAGKTIYKRTEA